MLEIELTEVSVTQMGFAMLLKAGGSNRIVPVFIGPMETYSISAALEKKVSSRPLTHDLLKEVIDNVQYKVDSIYINDFQEGTFFARVHLVSDKGLPLLDLDARPSDAVAIALRYNAPMYMDEKVYEQTSVDPGLLKERPLDAEDEFLQNVADNLEDSLLTPEEQDDFIESILEAFGTEDEMIPPKKTPKKEEKKADRGEKTNSEKYYTREEVLQQMLKAAIKREKYEQAASLRDELKRLAKEPSSKRSSKKPKPGS